MSTLTSYLAQFQNLDTILRVTALFGTAALFGSTTLTSSVLIPSLTTSHPGHQPNGHNNLTLFSTIASHANSIMPLLAGITTAAFTVLTYRTRKISDGVALGCIVGAAGVGAVLLHPKLEAVKRVVEGGHGETITTSDANKHLGAIAKVNHIRVGLLGAALFVAAYDAVKDALPAVLDTSKLARLENRVFDSSGKPIVRGYPTKQYLS
ncbi:hypothetical protein SAICODRAFT_19603 [Saitoella complicata NRRL Y-17804]|uniref:Uncharacterized protein n=1 Tax=Saitoella complicata (strain BCRC 22490 / CBS 7301 / JCM 7358 / NBRC 10748 / NRRL Y-17804) TaxID=698492 RepID=A0A0E9NL74_SAICN|nr:uncharacterized protein SAICODRAFT_19603 [Saitoella complicata NRRL Y-17804]ODQ52819.1 hypothetical protein SAICODRAFT_19603 [Saitoella complicata NRRL Y-17804]GAO50421.1 hypothetical protein G7K_4547-t1 [Saitoella complicata NRRL Y-17804]